MKSLIIGHGQLGRAIWRTLGNRPEVIRGVPWTDPLAGPAAIRRGVAEFGRVCGDEPGFLCWSAGSGVVGTPEAHLELERRLLDAMLESATDLRRRSSIRVFVAGSAGGAYGCSQEVFTTEDSPIAPASAYGASKLQQDETALAWSATTGIPLLVGRISNLYSSDQNLAKPQGFISHLCRAVAFHRPFTLTVPSHTIRDFIHADDVARRVVAWSQRPDARTEMKLLVSGQSVTLGRVIGILTQITSHGVRVAHSSRRAAGQPEALRFRSVRLVDLDRCAPCRPLEGGISGVWMDTLRRRSEAQRVTIV